MSRDSLTSHFCAHPELVEGLGTSSATTLRQAQGVRVVNMGRGQSQAGFTLLEMLVALAVFSIAALALLNLETVTVTNTSRIADRTFGQIVARNVAVETLTDPAPPPIGTASGEEANGGRIWRWARITDSSPEERILQIEIAVTDEAGDHAANLTIFRFAAQ